MNLSALTKYLKFYLAAAVLYAIYSVVLDYIFFSIEDIPWDKYRGGLMTYFLAFLFLLFPFSLLFPMLYYFMINSFYMRLKGKFVLIPVGLLTGMAVGLMFGRHGVSYYIGEYRHLKNILLYTAIGGTLEAIRTLVIINRENARLHNLDNNVV